ncbi:glutathionylspermidine synthase family protein, partial [Sandarakinorhabdus sp.]|uniref:glutathionylspermidine synthase family protein n=1 Tax=Sandarakinorhabdus sp. TaxID=1916663 RepID=UPI00286DD6F3
MIRTSLVPRPNWRGTAERLGLVWHSRADGSPYWDESACYQFTPAQIAVLEGATAELYRLFLAAGQHVIDNDRLGELGIPAFCHRAIREAWDGEPRALNFGRFDLGWTGEGPPKLFEFNADTPTSLLEAAVIQWQWKEAVFPDADQFNGLHEALVARWAEIAPPAGTSKLHLTHARDASGEDALTIAYLADCAGEAGIDTRIIAIEDIGWGADDGRFVDLNGRAIDAIFKLYPWEWLLADDFGRNIIDSLDKTMWMEPIWKMLWSNKAMLAVLWELFPGHPNLLETRRYPLVGAQVKKPLLGREGANVTVMDGAGVTAETDGPYGEEGHVWQALYALPGSGDQH